MVMMIRMNKNNEYPELFDLEGHLNEEGQALTVDALILGKIPRLPAPVQDHISSCPGCRMGIASLYDLVAENKELHPRVHHPLFDREMDGPAQKSENVTLAARFFQRLRSPWGLAASVTILLALGVSWFFPISGDNDAEQIRQEIVGIMEADSTSFAGTMSTIETLQYVDNQRDRRLASQQGNPRLEAMYKLHLRGNDFKMMSPAKSSTVRQMQKIVFEWESSGDLGKLDLLIMDEQGVRRSHVPLKHQRYQFTVKLPLGLYYWVIVGDGMLMSVGKFNVTAG